MSTKILTIFTPTYNRAHTLPGCYESLKRQTNNNFIWLIIDDGSTDNTKMLVKNWIKEGIVDIRYHWKKNGGMHTAHNKAFELTDTELVCCLDSDDDLSPDAVEQILDLWSESKDEAVCGIIAHQAYRTTGEIIGTGFPNDLKKTKFYDLYYRYGVKGDKLVIYRTDKIRPNPYPQFEGERFVSLSYKYLMINEEMMLLDSKVYYKEYLEDGYTKNLIKIYARNPQGFSFYHAFAMCQYHSYFNQFKSAIHYIGTSLLCGKKQLISSSPKKLLTILALPFGLLWYVKLYYIRKSLLPMNKTTV